MSDSDSEWEAQQRTIRQAREIVRQKRYKATELAREQRDNAGTPDVVAATLAPSPQIRSHEPKVEEQSPPPTPPAQSIAQNDQVMTEAQSPPPALPVQTTGPDDEVKIEAPSAPPIQATFHSDQVMAEAQTAPTAQTTSHSHNDQIETEAQTAPPLRTISQHEQSRSEERLEISTPSSEQPDLGSTSEEHVSSPDPMDVDPPQASVSARTIPPTAPKRKRDASLPLARIKKESRPSSNAYVDARRQSRPQAQPRAANRSGPSNSHPTVRPGLEWYRAMARSTGRGDHPPSTDMALAHFKDLLQKCRDGSGSGPARKIELEKVITAIHDAMFLTVTAQLLRDHRLLFDQEGLPVLFDPTYMNGRDYPFFIKADAEELYYKWSAKDFETDLLRGLKIGKGKNEALGRDKPTSDSLVPNHPGRKQGNFFGAKPAGKEWSLVNGQWWPTQLCTVRDGAHMSAQGGISGREGQGAWSCVMSGDPKYPDRDEGDEVWYCGTDSLDGDVTGNTKIMLSNVKIGNPVRVIRSARSKNPAFAPAKGFRYDGVYQARSFEILDQKLQRHRFHLVRQPGQDPIRAGDGPEARPTSQELREYKRIQDERQFLA